MPFLNVTEQEALILRSMIREFTGGARNAPQRNVLRTLDEDNPQAPECYIALVPEGGIPALEPAVGTGTAGFVEGDRPGSADCDIYRIVADQLVLVGKSLEVWNLTETAISESWITVVRDKFGAWIAQTGGGSTCDQRNEVWMIAMIGDPLDGTFSLTFPINGVEETVNIDYDATAAGVKTALATHSELTEADLNVEGGPLPDTSVKVEFIGSQAGKEITLTSFSKANLSVSPGTGTTGDTEGVGVIVFEWTPGFTP